MIKSKPMDTKLEIQKLISESLKGLEVNKKPEEIHLEHPQDETHGDWATNVAMALTKDLKKSPREIAETLVKSIGENDLVESVEIAGPGFINFKLRSSLSKDSLIKILEEKENYGHGENLKDKKIRVEFAHPNPFKAFHIGHLRNIILGESIVRLLESQSANVTRTNYQGDVGMHIAKCIWALKEVDPKDYPTTADEKVALLGKMYAKGATAFEEDENIKKEIVAINKKIYSKEDPVINKMWDLGREWSFEKFRELYKRVDTTFHREFMESETLKLSEKYIKEALEKGILKESDGAVILDGTPYGIDTRVYLNSEKLPTYEGKELGLAFLEYEELGDFDLRIHVVAVEQISFFKSTFKAKELLDPKLFKDKQYHLAYEFVGLKSGKMSSRKGQVVLGNDILNEAHKRIAEVVASREGEKISEEEIEKIAIAAIKWSFLKISPYKYLAFDMEESINFEGDSGPYMQYTYARAKNILKQGGIDENLKISSEEVENTLKEEEELTLLKELSKFPEVVAAATKDYSPHYIAGYLLDLAQKFNSFYKKHTVLKADEQNKKARLALTLATAQVIQNGLYLLGIKTVEKM